MKNHSERRKTRIHQMNSPYATTLSSNDPKAKEWEQVAKKQTNELRQSIPYSFESDGIPLSPSLITFIKSQLSSELTNISLKFQDSSSLNNPDEQQILNSIVSFCLEQLLTITQIESSNIHDPKKNNEVFAKIGKTLVKALNILSKERFLDFLSSVGSTSNDNAVKSLLEEYDQYITKNITVFQKITKLHENILNKKWETVVEDELALQNYATAASEMGNKVWVNESNYYACQYCKNYFLPQLSSTLLDATSATGNGSAEKRSGNLAIKYYMKEISQITNLVDSSSNETYWDSLHQRLSQFSLIDYPNEKIRILDVGSCYNPLLKFEDLLPYYDVTAVDLCPADSSVFKCDFLTVQIAESYQEFEQKLDEHKMKTATLSSGHPTESNSPPVMNELLFLPSYHYHAIIMSLVLSYLPNPSARETMIAKARMLLLSPGYQEKPHHCGLLIIIEKESIFQSPLAALRLKEAAKSESSIKETFSVTSDDWKATISRKGFFLVNYRLHVSSDNRKSHIFIFKTSQNVESEETTKTVKPLWIKQDFYQRQNTNHETVGPENP